MKSYLKHTALGFLLLVSFLIIGCTPFSSLLFGPPGSLNITTFPEGASVMINGKDTGYTTPCLIENLTVGDHQVELILADRDIQKSEKVIIYSDQTTDLYVELVPHLNRIEADPPAMYLDAGMSQQINSVTAYYYNDNSKSINLSNCDYSSSSNYISINSSGLVTANNKGSAIVTVSYTEEGVTETDTININVMTNPVTLSYIEADPSSMAFQIGEEKYINSVTAYYSDTSSANVSLNNCSYSVNNDKVTVDNDGKVTGIEDGTSVITVSYTENGSTKTDTINVEVGDIEYRAFLVGVGDYINLPPPPDGDLYAPPFDVFRISLVLDSCKFGELEDTFLIIDGLIDHDATKSAILQGIASTFSEADENDISYFYFSGHGSWDLNTAYICPSDILVDSYSNDISVNELEAALSAIPGTKVIILDSCFSGGFIGKGSRENDFDNEKIFNFNTAVLDTFSLNQSRNLLTSNKYKVLTSAHYDQACSEEPVHPYDGYPYGIFTAGFCNGCGYDDGILYADTNSNTKITLDEMYKHVLFFVMNNFGNDQNVQVFPENSDFTIIEK